MKKLFGAILAFSLVFPTMNVYATEGDQVPPSPATPTVEPADGPKEPAPGPKTPAESEEPAGEVPADKQGETPEGGAEAAKPAKPAENAEGEAAPAEGETPAAKDEKKEEAAPAVDESAAGEKKEEPAAPAGEKENAEAPAGEKAEVEEDKKADKEEVSDKKEAEEEKKEEKAEDKAVEKDSDVNFIKVTDSINKGVPSISIQQDSMSTSFVKVSDVEGTLLEAYEVKGSVQLGLNTFNNVALDPYIGHTLRISVNDDVFKFVVTPIENNNFRVSIFSVSNDGTDLKNDKDTLVSSDIINGRTLTYAPIKLETPSSLVSKVSYVINSAVLESAIDSYKDKDQIKVLKQQLPNAKKITRSIKRTKVDVSTLSQNDYPYVKNYASKAKDQYQLFDITHFVTVDDNAPVAISEPYVIGLENAYVSIPLSELNFPALKDGYKRSYTVLHDNHKGGLHTLPAHVSDGYLVFQTSSFSHFIVEYKDELIVKPAAANAGAKTVSTKNNSASTGVHVQPHPAPEGAVWNPLTGLFDAKPGYKWDDAKQTFVRDGSVSRIPSTGDEGLNLYIAMLVAGMVAVASASYKLVQSKH